MTVEQPVDYQKLAQEIQSFTTIMKKRMSPLGKDERTPFAMNKITSAIRGNELLGLSLAGSKFFSAQSKFRVGFSNITEHGREIEKIQKKRERIEYEIVEEPGVIPRTLAVIENILKRFNTVDQLKLETTLDSINGNLENSKMILNGINVAENGVINLALKYKTIVKIGLAIAVIGLIATMVLIPILMLRIIIFGIT